MTNPGWRKIIYGERDTAWMDHALCATHEYPELWHPFTSGDTCPEGRAICMTCPVQLACLEYAIAGDETGIWGGIGESEREAIKRNRRKAKK